MDERDNGQSRNLNPPYISANAWQPFFEKMQKVKRPTTLSLGILKEYGIKQGPALQSAIKFLGLVDERGNTTDLFPLIQLRGEQFKRNLAQIIETAYHDLLAKHSLEHAEYEDVTNYFAQKYSPASASKMTRSLSALCDLAGLATKFTRRQPIDAGSAKPARRAVFKKGDEHRRQEDKPPSGGEELVREFIKTNPIPQGVQWDEATIKAFFAEYRSTVNLLRGGENQSE